MYQLTWELLYVYVSMNVDACQPGWNSAQNCNWC